MINDLVTALSASGVTFVRDAWVKMPSTDYGVVDVASTGSLWADNVMIEQSPTVNVWLYTHDSTGAKARSVNGVLNNFGGSMGFELVTREYLSDVGLIRWHWQVRLEEM